MLVAIYLKFKTLKFMNDDLFNLNVGGDLHKI